MRISRSKWYERLQYTPRSGQRALDEAAAKGHRYLSLFAFPRAGKSYGAARHVEPDLLQHDYHVWVVAPTYELGSKEFGYIWTDMLEMGFLQMASSRHYDKRGGNMQIEWPWGSFVKVVSADNPSSLRAEELDALILAEASALPADIFYQHLYARVEKRKGKVLVPTTPKGFNWVHDTFRLPSLFPGHKELNGRPNPLYDSAFWSAVVSSVPEYGDILEPGIYDDETIERARRTMPLPFFKEQFGGDFSSYAGLIYPWDPRQHVVEPFEIPREWVHVIGWDHGSRDINPTAIVFGSYSPDGTLYLWSEVYEGGKSVREYATKLRVTMGMKRPAFISTDPSANQVRIELNAPDIGMVSTFPQEKHIDARIIRITQMLRDGKMKVLRGRCPNFEKEMRSWEWDEKNPGKPRPNQPCHALDAVGYAVLIPVGLMSENQPDPLNPPNEDLATQALWRGVRRRWHEMEENTKFRDLERELIHDPFEESMVVESYEPGL